MKIPLSELSVSAILDLQLARDCTNMPTQEEIQLWLDTLLSYQQLTDK